MKFKKWFSKNEKIDENIEKPKKVDFNTKIEVKKAEEIKEIKPDPITNFENYECDVIESLKLSRRGTYEGYFSIPPLDPKSLKILYNGNILIDNGKSTLVLDKDKKVNVGKVITAHGYYNINGSFKEIGKIPKKGVVAKYNIYHQK